MNWYDKKDSVNERIFPKTKISKSKCKSWIKFVYCATKLDLKNAAGVAKLDFTKKIDFANLKSDVNKLDMINLKMYQMILNQWIWKVR